jgi:hypothetical protein
VLGYYCYLIADHIGAGPNRLFVMSLFGASTLYGIGYIIHNLIIDWRRSQIFIGDTSCHCKSDINDAPDGDGIHRRSTAIVDVVGIKSTMASQFIVPPPYRLSTIVSH